MAMGRAAVVVGAVAALAAAAVPARAESPVCTFDNPFQSSMVLQADAPLVFSGVCTTLPAQHARQAQGRGGLAVAIEAPNGTVLARGTATVRGSAWSAELPPLVATATPLRVVVADGAGGAVVAALSDVLVGMVLLVSGQSNVGISVIYSNQFNKSAEAENERAADALGATVRLRAVPQCGREGNGCPDPSAPSRVFGTVPDCALPSAQCGSLSWARANRTNVQGYSALGWYLAREVVALLAAKGLPPVVGVIQSDVPGTPIQLWSRNETIRECTNATTWGSDRPTSTLFNTMISPLVECRVAVAAAVWYQGESNVGAPDPMEGADYYACALPTLISDWRAQLASPASTKPMPFFVVELAAYCNEQDEMTFRTFCDANTSKLTSPDFHLPEMRVAQASALGAPDAYVVSAMDLGSLHPLPYESIHPTNKQEVARRASLGLAHAVLGDSSAVFRGPVPTSAAVAKPGRVTVAFSTQAGAGGLALNASASCPSVVLDVYCRRAQTLGFEVQVPQAGAASGWAPPSFVALTSDGQGVVVDFVGTTATRVRYAFSDWPVVSLRNAVGGLPARLFDIAVTTG